MRSGGASKRVQQLAEGDQDSKLLMTIPRVGYILLVIDKVSVFRDDILLPLGLLEDLTISMQGFTVVTLIEIG